MRHRIVQFKGRRYSIKLEPPVWAGLEAIAAASGRRFNQLVAEMAERAAGNHASLTGALRAYCLEHAQSRVQELQAAVRDFSLVGRGAPLALIAEACPAPCVIAAQDHVVLAANAAMEAWLGIDAGALVGTRLDHYFHMKMQPALADIVEAYRKGRARVVRGRAIVVRPGRLVMSRASICPAMICETGDLSYFVFLSDRF